jgi:hypothetical protein
MALRLGDTAPDFEVSITLRSPCSQAHADYQGRHDHRKDQGTSRDLYCIKLTSQFHDYIKGSWTILFSHPDDYVSGVIGLFLGCRYRLRQEGIPLFPFRACLLGLPLQLS